MNFIELVPSYFLSDTIANVPGRKITGIKNANIYLRSLLLDDVRRGKVHPSEILSFLKLPEHLQYLDGTTANNYSITMDFIRNNPDLEIPDYVMMDKPDFTLNDLNLFTTDEGIHLTDNITFQDVLDNPDLHWDYHGIISDTRLSREFILDNISLFESLEDPTNYQLTNSGIGNALFVNPNLNEDDLRFIMTKFDIEFDSEIFELRKDLSIEFIEENYELFKEKSKTYGTFINTLDTIMYFYKNITEEFIEKHLEDITYIYDLSLGHNDLISLEFLSKYKYRMDEGEGPTDYYSLIGDGTGISTSKILTMDDIHKYPNLPWKFDLIVEKSNIDINEIMEEITMYHYDPLLKNPNFKLKDYPNFDKPEYYTSYSKNPGVKMNEVEELDQGYWNFEDLSSNINMTFDFYNKYRDTEIRKVKFPNSEGDLIPEKVLESLYMKDVIADREEKENQN